MSAEEPGSEGRWFGDDYDRHGVFGNRPTQLSEEMKRRTGEVASDLDQQFHLFQDDGKRPPVAMETASTGKPVIYRHKLLTVVKSESISVAFGFIRQLLSNPRRYSAGSTARDGAICRRSDGLSDDLSDDCVQT